MITVAMAIPQRIASEDFLISMPSRDAIRAPVHAPVPGRGIPTNNTSPQNSYLLDLFTSSHRPVFQFFDQSPEAFYFFHPLEDLLDKQQDKRNG